MKKIKIKQIKKIDNTIKCYSLLGKYYLYQHNNWRIDLQLKKNIIYKFLSICNFIPNVITDGYSIAIDIIKDEFSTDFITIHHWLKYEKQFDKLQSILNEEQL